MTMDLIRGVRFAIVTMVLFGGAYPFAIWGLAQMAFPYQAQGSLVLGGYSINANGNFGPTNPDHLKAVRERVAAARKREAVASGVLPADLVTASGAGLDPHLSPAAVDVQVARIARVRGAAVDAVRQIVAAHIEPPTLGVLGRARVNVLQLNLALDAEFPHRAGTRQDSTHD